MNINDMMGQESTNRWRSVGKLSNVLQIVMKGPRIQQCANQTFVFGRWKAQQMAPKRSMHVRLHRVFQQNVKVHDMKCAQLLTDIATCISFIKEGKGVLQKPCSLKVYVRLLVGEFQYQKFLLLLHKAHKQQTCAYNALLISQLQKLTQ